MSINLIDLMKDQLTGAVAGQIGSKLGVDPKSAESGIGAILPTILGGLMKQSSTAEGAESLNNTLDQADFDGGLLDKLPDLLGGGGGDAQGGDLQGGGMLAGMGDTVLRSLFGDKIASIVGLISKFTGMDSGKSGSLMALLAPLVMSFLGKQKRSMGLDASGLAGLLSSQKDAVAENLPPGLAGTLGLGEFGITDEPQAAAAPTPAPAQAPAQSGGGLGKVLIPLAILAALAFLAFRFLGGGGDAINNAVVVPKEIDAAVPELPTAEGVTEKATAAFTEYTSLLKGVEDEESAKEAASELDYYNQEMELASGMLSKLPEAARGPIVEKLKSLMEPLQAVIEKAYAIPGAKAVLEPVVGKMLDTVKGIVG